MKKKRFSAEEPAANGGRWFLTYSDMITLLLALFIMLYSMSSINEKKYEALAKGLHNAFVGTAQTGSGTGTGYGTGSGTGDGNVLVLPGEESSSAVSNPVIHGNVMVDALTQIYNELSDYVRQNNLQDEIELKDTGSYVEIHLKDIVLFQPNSSTMLDSSKPIMKEIEAALSKVYDQVDHIKISGHTADVVVDPVHSDELSWQLSTERATTVLEQLTAYGLNGKKLSAEGYAHFDPIATNSTEEGRSKNRRVEISVFKNPTLGTGATGRDKLTTDSTAPSSSAPVSSASSASGKK